MDLEQSPDMADARREESGQAAPAPSPTPKAPARLVEYAQGRRVALPVHTTYALVEKPAFVEVPGGARYAYGLLTWQEDRLPLLDLDTLLHPDQRARPLAAPNYALVLAYQREPKGPLAYGTIALATLPQTIEIGDEAQCELPGDSRLWPLLALSCFLHEGQAVPILDTGRLFSAYHHG